MPSAGSSSGSSAMSTNAAGEDEREHVVGQPRRDGALDGGEEDAPDGHHPPERRERERRLRRRRTELARHVELRPVAVDRLADAVEDGEARVHPEPSRDREPCDALRRRRAPRSAAAGAGSRRSADEQERAERSGRPHQKPSPSKIATNTGASTVPSPSSAFRTRIERLTAVGLNAAVNVLSAGTVKPKPAPRLAVARSSSP